MGFFMPGRTPFRAAPLASTMSVQGLCQVCESAQAKHTCDRCGAMVCDDHWDRELGYCSECAAEYRRARGDADRGHHDLDRDDPGPGDTYQQ
jgi:hypothetical protein